MAGFPIRQYQRGGEFVVVRAMDYGLRHFEAGDPFPWREMGIHEATVQMLWKAVRIEVKRDPVPAEPVVVAPTSRTLTPPPPAAPSTPAKPTAPPHQHQHNRQHRR
jgi:hypothetical protein